MNVMYTFVSCHYQAGKEGQRVGILGELRRQSWSVKGMGVWQAQGLPSSALLGEAVIQGPAVLSHEWGKFIGQDLVKKK